MRLPKFPAPSSTLPSPCHRHRDCLHAGAAIGNRIVCPTITAVPRNYAVPLLLRYRDQAAAFPTVSTVVAGSTSPGRHRRQVHAARPSPPHPRTASSSQPLSGPHSLTIITVPGNRAVLQAVTATRSTPPQPSSSLFPFPSPSINSVLLCLDVWLYDYA
jgi:hypothetical protein